MTSGVGAGRHSDSVYTKVTSDGSCCESEVTVVVKGTDSLKVVVVLIYGSIALLIVCHLIS